MLRAYTPLKLSNFGAQAFYRVSQPMSFLQHTGRATVYFDLGELEQNISRGAAQDFANIHWLHQRTDDAVQRAIERYMGRPSHWLPPAAPDAEPAWDAPPSIILDTDDDVFNAMPFHRSTFRYYGTRDIEGNPLEPGDAIIEKGEDEGKETVQFIWEDGKDGLDLQANINRLAQWRTNLAIAALVTVSTPEMERVVHREVPNANTFVLPNCINFDDYPELRPFEEDGKVRILWQGGSGHEECLRSVLPALKAIHDKYDHVEFLFWGGVPDDVLYAVDSDRWRALPWCSYFEYKLRLNSIGHDINICPLFEHPFNKARSAIKWYESSACSKPAATLAKNFAAFGDEIEDGVTGLLYNTPEEFEAQLERLINDAELRKSLGAAAKAWVKENRDPAKWAHKLADKLEELRSYKLTFAKPPIAAPEPAHDVSQKLTDVRDS